MPSSRRTRGLLVAALLVALGAGAFTAARLVSPGPADTLLFQGQPFGAPCPYLASTGDPCPACGMTRSWVWAARGQTLLALRYSPAGTSLFAGLLALGGLGAARLMRRDPTLWPLPWQALVGATGLFLVLWEGVWLLRLQGYLPLP